MRKIISRLIDNVPDILKNGLDWAKDNFDAHAKVALENTTGTVGLVIKVFGQSLIDKYFDKLKENKLKDFGEITYLKAAFKQATKSITTIENELNGTIQPFEITNYFSSIIINDLKTFNPDKILLIFQPEYHPSIIFVKNNYVNLLKKLDIKQTIINSFLHDFNSNIAKEVEISFGEDYEEHLKLISSYSLQKNEARILWDTAQLNKIGFDLNENLKYEETYASWKDLNSLKNFEIQHDKITINEEDEENNSINEEKLQNIKTLIEEYFSEMPDNHLEKILFIVADFGKGKSVFLKQYASELAKNYISTKQGLFPVYFNLRNFHNYSHNTKLGVIEDYLLTDYGIDISSPYFCKKQYIFLVDSLDESGELNKFNIENVINSVKQIQNIDKAKYRTNKIIITTRPFDDGLNQQLNCHKPKTKLNKEKREVIQYLSLYGFQKKQFNRWLLSSIKDATNINAASATGITSEILKAIASGTEYDVYKELIKNKTLSKSELTRPIFAYMIYQLILNNVNFLEVGKIGIYLSFLNLLSKDAKHINDPNYKVNLKEEFEYRNLLHTISSLWMFERHQGKQGSLSKADICRVLDGFQGNESDNEVLQRYKNQGVTEIEFLSHSYFGENDNKLHFQHQSFAEILLAEYYLKVFIKYSLDEDFNVEEARTKLVLGFPTDQTINFLIDLLKLLKESSETTTTTEIIEKRKLLFPLLATLATKKNNRLFCNDIYYEWFKKSEIKPNESNYPINLITNWYFDKTKIDKILLLCKEILNSKNTYLITKSEPRTALYNNELTLLQNVKINDLPLDFDKWIALLVGNSLCNNLSNKSNPVLFNTKFEISPSQLFDLIIQSSSKKSVQLKIPSWGKNLFIGIDMRKSHDRISIYSILNNLDFSYSYLKNINFSGCLFGKTKFNYISLDNVDFSHSYMWDTSFKNIMSIENSYCRSIVISDFFIPFSLIPNEKENRFNQNKQNHIIIPEIKGSINDIDSKHIINVIDITSDLLSYFYAKKIISIKKINDLIKFESDKMKKDYIEKIKT